MQAADSEGGPGSVSHHCAVRRGHPQEHPRGLREPAAVTRPDERRVQRRAPRSAEFPEPRDRGERSARQPLRQRLGQRKRGVRRLRLLELQSQFGPAGQLDPAGTASPLGSRRQPAPAEVAPEQAPLAWAARPGARGGCKALLASASVRPNMSRPLLPALALTSLAFFGHVLPRFMDDPELLDAATAPGLAPGGAPGCLCVRGVMPGRTCVASQRQRARPPAATNEERHDDVPD